MNLEILKEIGEWAAYGFYEGEHLPHPRSYGLAYRRMYENMDVSVDENILLTPSEPLYKCKNMLEDGIWAAADCILSHNHNNGLTLDLDIASEKKEVYPSYSDFIDELCADLSDKLFHKHQYTHSNPDIYTIINKGFNFIKESVDKELANAKQKGAFEEVNFLLAMEDYIKGIDTYFQKVKERLSGEILVATGERKVQLEIIHNNFSDCFYTPATSFIGGLLAVNLTWMLDGCDSIGRIDYALGDLFEADISSGKLDIQFARKLLDDMWFLFEKMNAWNLQLGGYKPNGEDCCNLLTKECLLACGRNKLRRPNVAFRINKKTNKEFTDLAMEMLSNGSGKPALYNDDLYISLLMENFKEMPYVDAVMYGLGGCTETMITGMSNVDSLAGQINLAYALSLAMFDGFDIVKDEQVGVHSGLFESFESFEEFMVAVKKQIKFLTESFVAYTNDDIKKRMTMGDPKIARSLFTMGCIKNHKSFEAGGARYNWVVVSYDGSSVLIDSINAIKEGVFTKKLISKDKLINALRNNFVGYETEKEILKNQPTYGNDFESVDLLGSEILKYAWELLLSFKSPRGGKYVPSVILFTTYEFSGLPVCATANGRNANTYLNDSIGACQGVDVNGPTALINSVLRLPIHLAFGTPVLNMRFHKSLMETENGIKKVVMLMENYFKRGGLQLQISVLSNEEMIKAQKEPEKYRDLIVRIGGYSEYFINLSKGLQDSVIKRSEYL